MIDVTKAFNITKSSTSQTRIMSNNLRNTFLRSKISRDKLFRQEVKVQKLREETFNALKNALRDARNKQNRGGGLLGTALGLGGAGAVGRRFRGGGGGLLLPRLLQDLPLLYWGCRVPLLAVVVQTQTANIEIDRRQIL